MKKIYLILFTIILSSNVKSQWVTIPDTSFVNWLTGHYPSCMNGNQMDTTCTAITTAGLVQCPHFSIVSLEGIQYFDALQSLEANNNLITYLPPLPQTLFDMNIGGNLLSTLPPMPPNLSYLVIAGNRLTTLPFLPQSLSILICGGNFISTMPILPSGLQFLQCGSDSLTSFTALPSSLKTFDCSYSPLLTTLPTLPDSLDWLVCDNCSLTQLPALPDTLTIIECGNNFLSSLPTLPPHLQTLDCAYNQITSLPTLPSSIFSLALNDNQLTSLPTLPGNLSGLYINNNPDLHCLPRLDTIHYFRFSNTGINCLPNYGHITDPQPSLTSLPLCDLFNSNNCDFYWNINGKVFQDLDADCIPDSNESLLKNIKINLSSGGTFVQSNLTDINGLYSFENGLGNYDYSVDTTDLPYNVICPPTFSYNSNLTPIDSIAYDKNFGLECKPSFDLIAYSIAITGRFFPNSYSTVHISAGDFGSHFGLACVNNISGTVEIQLSGPISYTGPTSGSLTPTVNGNSLLYTISNFGNVNFNTDFNFFTITDSMAQAGDTVCIDVSILPIAWDRNPGNNELSQCFLVVNSFDPNEKEVYPMGNIIHSQEWLTYTVHFQNTGTASANNIYLLDTLDSNLDISSFTFLNSNHDIFTQLNGNVLRFNFPNIYLPDSTTDLQNSQGYVQYKIKLVNGLSIGSTIRNTADIFFDYNPPIRTNTVINTFNSVISVNEIASDYKLMVTPNPVNDKARIRFHLDKQVDVKIEMINSLGKQVKIISEHKHSPGETEISFSTIEINKGVYYIRFSSDGNQVIKKIIKF